MADGKSRVGSDLLESLVAHSNPGGSVSMYVVCTNERAVANPKGWRLHAILIRILLHTILRVFHSVSKELMDFVEVHGKVLGA